MPIRLLPGSLTRACLLTLAVVLPTAFSPIASAADASPKTQSAGQGANPILTITSDGQTQLENALVQINLSKKTGGNDGITSWLFKPTRTQQVDLLYGQTDYLTGHVFAEVWDPVNIVGFAPTSPRIGSIYAPQSWGQSADGSAVVITHSASDSSRLVRQTIIRRDLATVEVRFKLTNLTAPPYAASMRLHTIWSPAPKDNRYQSRQETIFLMTDAGPLALDQSMTPFNFENKYKGYKFFNDSWAKEPARSWVNGKQPTPTLTGDWAVQVGQGRGDGSPVTGMVMILHAGNLVGYYNALGATIEPVVQAFALRPGDSWETSGYLASFAGFSGLSDKQPIVNATPLYVATEAIRDDQGKLRGQFVPLFQGKLRGVDASGKAFLNLDANPATPITLDASLPTKGDWRLEAVDTQGKRIGVIDAQGNATLDPAAFADRTPKPPATGKVARDVTGSKGIQQAVADFIQGQDFVVYCDFNADADLQASAKRIARKLGVGVIHTQPAGKAILIGDPAQSLVIRQAGQFKHDISESWPGKGKGVILSHALLETTQHAAIVVAGSDAAAAQRAADAFEQVLLRNVKAPAGFTVWPATPADVIQPYTPAGHTRPAAVRVSMARGEYEPAQIVITAYDDIKGIDVTLAPLVNDATGQPMKGKYLTNYRKQRGPLWLRWVRNFPLDPANGWSGTPDPLTDYPVKDLPAGRSQALWLTVITPEDAQPGLYRSTLSVKVGDVQQDIPIEVTVWGFNLPSLTGLQGEPYMSIPTFTPHGTDLSPPAVKALTENLVEHGMRVFSLDGQGLIRWHFSPEGAFKGKDTPWLTVSEDGKVAMDSSGMDWLIDEVDKAAKPYPMSYRLAINDLVGWPFDIGRFRQLMPKRFEGLPERKGHAYQSYYAQEMIVLLRRHLASRNLLDRFVLKIGDEPRSFQWWWEEFTLAAREANMPFMTCLNSVDWSEVDQALDSPMKWIQPLYMHYDKDFYKKAREHGKVIGWYNCGPPPRNSVGTSASELRSYIWQAAKADIDLIAWWGVQNWSYHAHHGIWYDRYSHWNSLIYPQHPAIKPWRDKQGQHDASPLDSLRWEHIRDGMEDAWYVNLLRERIAQARQAGKADTADKAQATLDKVWQEVYPDHSSYRPPYARMMQARASIAQAILDLQ